MTSGSAFLSLSCFCVASITEQSSSNGRFGGYFIPVGVEDRLYASYDEMKGGNLTYRRPSTWLVECQGNEVVSHEP